MFSKLRKIFKEYKDLKYLAYHDPLTGLLNRNWFYKNIETLNRYKFIYFIDINNLHEVNKKGHTVGDQYIKTVVNTIKRNGILIRYAGDEFILFSNFLDEVKSNDLFTVGFSTNYAGDLFRSINEADMNMITQKNGRKLKSYEKYNRY